jgi:predicted GIY-YIG superfamily endonuclease
MVKWTYELLKEEALKYKTIKEFRLNSPNGYAACIRRKIIRELTTHMEPLGHRFSRMVYVYEFPDNHAYVGLTYNKDKRHDEHMTDGRGPVYKHMKSTGNIPVYKMVSDGYIPKSDAKNLEIETHQKYLDSGWIMLNSAKCGALGGNDFKYSEDELKSVALKYKNRSELKKNDMKVYTLIIHRRLYHLFNHMEWNGNTTYNLEEVIKECKKYETRMELRKKNRAIYFWVCVNDHKEICFSHMKQIRNPKWDINEAIKISKKYTYIADFKKNDKHAYYHLVRNGYDVQSYLKVKPRELKERKCKICNQTPNEVKFNPNLSSTCHDCYNKIRRKRILDKKITIPNKE